MKTYSARTLTASTVLIAALIGGAAGGAIVLGGDSDPAPRPVEMGLKVAETEAQAEPVTEPAPAEPAEVSQPAEVAAPGAASDNEVSEATEEAPVATTPTESAREAADRAEKAAQRAEDAAAKVTKPSPSPSPVATPVATPAPRVNTPPPLDTSYDCPAGSKYHALGATQTKVRNPSVDDCGGPWPTQTPPAS